MAAVSLRISIVEKNVTKTMQFNPSTSVFDACKVIREKIQEANLGQPKDYGLFLADEDQKKGVWLEPGRNLDYYILRNGDLLEYKKKLRTLRVRMLDGTLKTLLVDDSQPVANLMVVICTKIGITNHEEYSLVRDNVEDELENKPNNFGTLTLRRKKEEKEKDAKMEQLRKKLKTDDEVNWVDPSKTLREQGIDESETVLLRRKFFFSDQNIDSRDPVQLNLLYVQARDAILDGTHPVTQEKACEFAGIQCQIQFGDYVESKHRPGFLDLKEFLPQGYVKVKNIEKKIFAEHKKHQGQSELDAKVLYTKTARSLKTYGVAFFLVKEKMKGKNKLVPRLLGVTKESVLRLDEKTKEILKTWPLTTVRRWGASPNTFTLDFGDYSDEYYSVQTTEGEQIQDLISGYIDIILKKKQAKDHFGIEGDEGSTMVEDSVSPSKATILQHESSKIGKVNTESVAKPAVMRAGADGARTYNTGHMGTAQYTTVSGQLHLAHSPSTVQQTKVTSVLSEPQRALLSTISAGHEVIVTAEKELITKVTIPRLGSDPASIKWKETTLDTNKQNVSSQIAAMNAATAQVVTLTSSTEEVDHRAVGAAITTIASNLPEMTRGVRMIAALMDDSGNGEKLLDAARQLCHAFSDLLRAAEPEAKEPRQNLLSAASRVGEASHQVLTTIGEDSENNRELQDMLLSLAKAVANTTAALVLKAKNIAATCEDPVIQNKVITAATQCALATSQLVACSKVVAPTLHSPACQQQLIVAVKEVTKAVEDLVSICNEASNDENLLRELSQAAAEVTRTLNDLLNHIKNASMVKERASVHESAVETILISTDRLLASSGDSAEMVRQARILGQATAQLIQAIKGEAEKQPDSEIQKRLLAAAKVLADATARMVEAARLCASNPHDMNRQNSLRRAVEDLRSATTQAVTPALRRKLISKLEAAAKQAASDSIQCISAAQNAGQSNQSRASQEELLTDCRALADALPRLAEAVKGTLAEPDNPTAQLNLINASEQFLQPGARVVQSARAVLPTISDQSSALQLSSNSQQLASSLNDLRTAIDRSREVCGGFENEAFTSAEQLIRSLKVELDQFQKAALRNELRPLPGETPEGAALQLGTSSKNVRSAMAQLQTAAAQQNDNYTGHAAQETAHSLKDLTSAVRGVAATTNDRQLQTRIIQSADSVMDKSLILIEEARHSLLSHEKITTQDLINISKEVSAALNQCVSCLPGQKDVDEVINNIDDASQILNMNEFPHTNKTYNQLQQELNCAAANLNDASSEVVRTVSSSTKLAQSSKQFGHAFHDLMGVSMEMAGQTRDTEVRTQMVVSLKNVTMVSSKLLTTAKTVASNPTAPNAKNQLAAAARAVTESINYLVDVCTSAAPGQKECDNAIRNIQAMRPLLDNTADPINDSTYFECLDTVMSKSKSLGDGMTGIANHAKKSEHEQFGEAVKGVSSSICGLVEAAAQAAYLVGVSDPSSVIGRPGLLDQAQLARASQAIQTACQDLVNPTSNQQQVLSAATVIAKHTSALCNACRLASSKTTNPVAKRHFVQSAKDVANSTANLVKEIKMLDQEYNERNRENTARATKPLLEAVENLCTFAGSPEFASQPAKISIAARAAQEPITAAGHSIIDGSCAMVKAAKSLAVSPRDPPTWQLLANHSKSVSDSIKKLVSSIRDKAPGQKECDAAIETLNAMIKELDQTALLVVSQSLQPHRENTLQGFTDHVQTSVNEISEKLTPLKTAAKFQAENVGHAVTQFIQYFEPLVKNAIGAASNMIHSQPQMVLLDQTKTLTECASQLIYATKEGGGNPKAISIHPDIDESTEATREALHDLNVTLEHLSTQAGVITGLLDTITRAMTRVADNRSSTIGVDQIDSFVDYQTRMVARSKEIARIAQEMVTKSGTDVQKLGQLSAELTKNYSQLANDSIGAASSTSNADVSTRIRSGIQMLGRACSDLVKAGNNCQMAPLGDSFTQRDVADAAKHVSERVSQILAALQAGSRGTQACINAASTVSGIIGDLDTTIMFATAGTLHAENENETFADHRENILKTAKALVEDTKTLVAGAASSQEQLAVAAQNAVSTIVQLAEVVKFGAASLGSNNPEAQVMLINAVKDVASALGDLIHATKSASGKGIDHPSMNHLKDSAKVMVTNVTSLLKTVKAVEDEHTRGTRALEATIEAIAQEIRALQSPEQYKSSATPEDLVRCTKPITTATARAVAAGNSGKQDDAIVAANVGRKAISDMLSICKGVANNAETLELKTRTLQAGHDVAVQYRELLQAILHVLSKPGQPEAKNSLPVISRKIAQCVTELVASAQLLKGSDWVDPDDPTVIAENELLGAANSIDAAAKKLASLRPRRSIQETDESLNFDEMILEAAKSIAAATSALVKAASAAQRELIDNGKVSRRPLTSSDDGQWSEGLISAARLVAAATHSLVEAANSLVQGVGSEEKLISAAKQVASSTAQLLVACKVKADPDADSTKRLQAAGNAVKRATDNLVRAAQQAIQQEEERSLVLNKRMVGGIAQEINARSEVYRIERELEEARSRLTAIRQAKYKIKGGESDGETDGYQSGYESFTTRYETRSFENSPAHGQSSSISPRHYTSLKSPEKVSDAGKGLKPQEYDPDRFETITLPKSPTLFSSFGKVTPSSFDSQKSPTNFSSFGKVTPSPSEPSVGFGHLSPTRKEGSVFSQGRSEDVDFPPPPPQIYESKNGQVTKTETSSEKNSEIINVENDEISNLQKMMMKQQISSQKTVEKRSFTRTTQQSTLGSSN